MTTDPLSRRRQLLVDGPVQGAILWRIAVYWFCCLISITLLQACWIVLTTQPANSSDLFNHIWRQCGPALLASLLLLPIIVLDCVRLTNRFTGPIVRLRRQLRQVANDEPTTPLVLRKGDFWTGLADDYNAAIDRLNTRIQKSTSLAAQPSEESLTRFSAINTAPANSSAESTL